MGILEALGITKKSELLQAWRQIKRNAEKARGGKSKPNDPKLAKLLAMLQGRTFEAQIEKLEKELRSAKPNAHKVSEMAKILRRDLNTYGGSLDYETEEKFKNDIAKFAKVSVGAIVDAMEELTELEAARDKHHRALWVRFTHADHNARLINDRMESLRQELEACTDPKLLKGLRDRVTKAIKDAADADKALKKTAAELEAGLKSEGGK